MTRMSATETARGFSEVLNRVAAGEEIEVVRNGMTVAVICPPRPQFVSAERFREIVGVGTLDEDFLADVRAVRDAAEVPEDAWQSSSTPTI
jgi:prevent-host-death family protein